MGEEKTAIRGDKVMSEFSEKLMDFDEKKLNQLLELLLEFQELSILGCFVAVMKSAEEHEIDFEVLQAGFMVTEGLEKTIASVKAAADMK